jgi:hypothetical protein
LNNYTKNFKRKNYNFENYVENLLFAEYISQILWIGESQEIIINNTIYKIFVGSVYEDLYYAGDIVLEDISWNTISLDITLYKRKKSWILKKGTDHFNKWYVINYRQYQRDFQNFVDIYKKYIHHQWSLPIGELRYNTSKIKIFEQRISSIIHP